MCDQSKSLATSFMCGKDLDNYLKNPYYAGPFTQGTRMLNKYRTKNTNPCIDHYENLQFEGCCNAVKSCSANKKSNSNGCDNKRSEPKQNCGCNKKPSNDSCSEESNSESSENGDSCPPPASKKHEQQKCPLCKRNKPNEEEGEDLIAKRCEQLYSRGRSFLRQVEQTRLPKIEVEEDEYLPSIMGGGWQIATQPKILGKSKFQVKKFDPYLMLHSWQAMQCMEGGCNDENKNGDNKSDKRSEAGSPSGEEGEENEAEEEAEEEL